jgi:hypothetical protein
MGSGKQKQLPRIWEGVTCCFSVQFQEFTFWFLSEPYKFFTGGGKQVKWKRKKKKKKPHFHN